MTKDRFSSLKESTEVSPKKKGGSGTEQNDVPLDCEKELTPLFTFLSLVFVDLVLNPFFDCRCVRQLLPERDRVRRIESCVHDSYSLSIGDTITPDRG